jgi:hypothetical protein
MGNWFSNKDAKASSGERRNFQQMMLDHTNAHMQKDEFGPLIHKLTKTAR